MPEAPLSNHNTLATDAKKLNNLETVGVSEEKYLEKRLDGGWGTFVKLKGGQIVVDELRLSKNYFPGGFMSTSLVGKIKRPFRPIGRTECFDTEVSFLPFDSEKDLDLPYGKNTLNIIRHYKADGSLAFVESVSYAFIESDQFNQITQDLASFGRKARIKIYSDDKIFFGEEIDGRIFGTHDVGVVDPIAIDLKYSNDSTIEISDAQFRRAWRCEISFIKLYADYTDYVESKPLTAAALTIPFVQKIEEITKTHIATIEKHGEAVEKQLSSF